MKAYNFSSRRRQREGRNRIPMHKPRLGPLNADGLATMIPFDEIFSPDSLVEAIGIIASKGGPAPGLDGIRVSDLSKRDRWAICRQLSGSIRAGAFAPSLPRLAGIPKADGTTRQLTIRSLATRIPAAALHERLSRFLDQFYLPMSVGFRPGLNTWHALVMLERAIFEKASFILVQDDIKRAFDNININLAMEDIARHVTERKTLNLIESLLRGNPRENREVGIDQGSAISPDALNTHLHHRLDLPYTRHGSLPLALRYADNLPIVAASVHEGLEALGFVREQLTTVGLELKGGFPPVDLRQEPATLLGFTMQAIESTKLTYGLAEEAWDELNSGLMEAYEAENPPRTATQVATGWIEANGPAFENVETHSVVSSVQQRLRANGFREALRETLRRAVQGSSDRWKAFHGKMCCRDC